MSGPLIRGWCPGARRPMMAGDGLVVRVRPPLGQLTPDQAEGLADLAQSHANGSIELTSRANLQLRGVAPGDHPGLIAGLAALGLLGADAASEGRRNLVLDPFRPGGAHDRIAAMIGQGLGDARFAALPAKFGFALDCGPLRHLAAVSADIRIEAAGTGLIVRAEGSPTGQAAGDEVGAARLALELAAWFIASGGVGADGRGRMARHLAGAGNLPRQFAGDRLPPNPVAAPAAPGRVDGGFCVAAAFGLMAARDLRALAQSGAALLRITPWRMVYLPQLDRFAPQSDELIVAPGDPLLRVWACTGAPGCPQASVATRPLARALARGLGAAGRLHVSGCAKGCARRAPAGITLVGRDGRFDLIRDGSAQDKPQMQAIAPEQIQTILGG